MADNWLLNDNNNDGVGGGDEIFVYTGGEQEVPDDVERVRIAENIDAIPARTFQGREQLIEVVGHNKMKKIEGSAFIGCDRLRTLSKMTGLVEIEQYAFFKCHSLSDIDFDKLEIIGDYAFSGCKSLSYINMPSIKRVEKGAFMVCKELTCVVFGQELERIEAFAFLRCFALRCIAIPLKDNLTACNSAFNFCDNLLSVDTHVGGIHNTISSLHLESWRDEMEEGIDSINQTLPNTSATEKAGAIQQWITRVLDRMEHYKSEHKMLVKEAMTLLELALWKAKLLNETDGKKCKVNVAAKKAKIDDQSARKEHRVTCGASIVVKNVLPFLTLK